MSDRKKCIPRSRQDKSRLPEESIGFHETLLALLGPDDRAAFRLVGLRLYEMLLEVRPVAAPGSSKEDAFHEEVEAAVADLLTARDRLWLLGQAVEDSSLDAENSRLSLACRDLVEPLDEVISHLQEALQ